MIINFQKYQGTGNDFIIINEFTENYCLSENRIKKLCDRKFGIGADGLMTISPSDNFDFKMKYYNSDGKEGSMCGNGGRCIAKYAQLNNISDNTAEFEAVDGKHVAIINKETVKLKLNDIILPENIREHIIDTGSPHIIIEVNNTEYTDVFNEGKKLRYSRKYSPDGTNVNFLEIVSAAEIKQRTYERGVENETFACGTGAVAGVAYLSVKKNIDKGPVKVNMPGGILSVDFKRDGNKISDLYLSGPAKKIFDGQIKINE